ncbi:hypothetical protein Osc7112_4159 [Oscillatoria nigro-viridis PCC 7112]|uniref:Uncharacterized protein n=1 Tax=Phormidium nigroviride PCC 7112 TaxID=179408 RepID=K9VLR7_9CYAN|nr:hypothetical protein [Oscillatoria nigro-viridis]AFZ08484.1 hypothetical protein Osc7112_4159 [Oscillatoria nigro-viridis PCC 7112]
MKFHIPLAPGAVTQFLLRVVTCLAVLSFLSQISLYYLPDYPLREYLAKVFNVDAERNLPTFYSFLALLFSSLLLGAIAYAKNLDSDRYKNHWKILSFIFLYLSLDEAGQLHEKFIDPTRSLLNGSGFLYFTWIVPFGLLVVIFLLSYSKFVFHLPVSTRKLFVAACALYIAGAIGMEIPGGYLFSTMGMESVPYLIVASIEELLEMLGIVVFIHALMSYIKTYLGGVSWNIYIPGKNTQVTEHQNIGLSDLSEPANTNLLR